MMRSKYTLFVENYPDEGKHLFFCTRTQAMVVVDEELMAAIEELPQFSGGKRAAEALGTLAGMGFLVQNEVEEQDNIARYFQALKSDATRVDATVLTTYACNFACPYCVEEGVKTNVHMDEQTAARTVAYIGERVQEHAAEKLFVSFYGGEPLLNLKALRIVSEGLQAFCRPRGVEFAVGITTNGALLTPEVVEDLLGYGLKGVKVTLDGFGPYHDRKRPYADGRGSFDRIVENVYHAVEKIDVDVGGNFDEENIDSFPRLLDHLKALGLADKLHRVRFKPISETPQDRAGMTDGAEMACVFGERSTAVRMVELRRLALERGFQVDPGVGVNACAMTANSAVFTIDPTGRIFKCPAFVGHAEFSAGSIATGETGDRAAAGEEAAGELWRRCSDCPYVPLCGEGCQFGSYLRYGDTSRLNCRKEFVEYMVRENLKLNYRYRQNKSG
jgi:uncharacterized protein